MVPRMTLARPCVLVTGGAQRIGAAISRAFAAAGWHVVIHYRRSDAAARSLSASLPSAEAFACDLADLDAARDMIRSVADRRSDFHALINGAAIFEHDDANAIDPGVARRAFAVNALAPAAMAGAFLETRRGPGIRTVVQLTDQKLANANPDFFGYTMAKHALGATVEMLAMAAPSPDDRVYGLAPGAILASHDQDEDEADRSHVLNLLARRTTADEVAAAAVFLAGGHLASGVTLFVDSGQHLLRQPRDVIYLAREAAA